MEYKIGEVSKILNISKEMIRYYEKQGILKPSRKEDNNYRTYSVMDVFLLMEIIRYQSIHFGIKDISELLNEHYLENYAQHLYQYYQEIDQDVYSYGVYKHNINKDKVTPALGVSYKITPELAVYSNYVEALVQGDAIQDSFGQNYVADPFVSKQKEIGLKYENGAIGGG